jgi:hypothetical protein
MVIPEAFRHGWFVAHRRIGPHPPGQLAQYDTAPRPARAREAHRETGYYAPSGSSNSTENSVGTGSSSLSGTRRSGQR